MLILPIQSQTQGGTRYTPELTRFYTTDGCSPDSFLALAVPVLQQMGFKCRQPEVFFRDESQTEVKRSSMRVGGHDARKLPLKGYIDLEPFNGGTFVVMKRDTVSASSCRRGRVQ